MNGEMNGVMANGAGSVVEDDTGFLPFQPAVPMEDVEEHAHFLVLAWVLLLYRSSTESAFTSGFYDIVSEERTATPSTSGFTAEIVSRTIEPVSTALGRVRDQSVSKPRQGCDGPTTMFFSNAGSDSDLSIHMEARVADGQLWVRHSQRPPIARRMAMLQVDAYMEILNSVLADQEQMCAQAMRLREGELAQLWQWNTPLAPRIDQCMHDFFAEQARRQPDRPAVVSWDGQLTYGELDALSTRLAGRLAALGAGVGAIIPLCFEKSVWMSVALIAVMKSGSAFSLTDPSQPEARLRVIAEEVGARVVITSESKADLGAQVAPEGATVLTVGPRMLEEKEEEQSGWEPVAVPPSATLYVIFTSGSTGKPKGIEISHSNYSSGAVPRGEIVGYRPHSRVLDFASYAFDVSIDCMLCTLSTGGVICVPSEEERMNDLGGAIQTMDANMAHMTPSVARVLDPEVMDRLEVLGLGGEAVSARDAASWSQRTRPVICYGPSECTVAATVNGDVAPGRTSIGKGCGGATWICDPEDHGRLVPVGAVGELLVEGPLVGKGYLHQPEKTAEVFIEDPPWLVAGGRRGRLYKTGDLVRYDGDGSGNIVFVGRKDAQVKLRGQRVELGEVEFHVRNHMPAGTNVAAEVVRPAGGEPTLVCFVATNGNTDSFPPALAKAISGLDQALSRDLPIYMLPSAYIPVERLPTLVSLKVDRKRLRELGAALSRQQLAKLRAAAAAADQREPTTPTECCLHRLWTDLFGEDAQVGVSSNFFALGGDSLAAMRLVAAARKEGLALGVADVFARPRLQDMARVVGCLRPDAQVPPFSLLPKACDAEEARAHAADRCSILRTRVEDVYPCTPLQEGLMALSAKVQSAYVAQRVVQLPDLPTAYRLRDAFNTAAQECHILRTRIVQLPGHGLMQVVVRGDLPWTSSSGSVESYLDQDRADEMGLGTALVRLAMVADHGSVDVVLTIHHALYDGWSMPLVIDRVNRAYRHLETNRPAPFRQFIHHLDALDRETSRKYWAQQLTGAGGPQFPALPFQGYQTQADALLERYITLPQKRASNTTLATAIRGAWALVAAQYTTDDVVFGETLTGRNANITGVEEIEGPMITTVPLRVHVDGRAPASVYLQTIHRDTVDRIPHEHFGLQHIRRLHHDAREACELRTGLIMHPTAEPEPADAPAREDEPALGFMPANDVEAAREALKFNSYALMLVCSLDPNGFLVMASFDQKTLGVARAEKALEQFEQAVQKLCEDGDVLVGNIDCVAAPGTYCTDQPTTTTAPAPKPEQPRRDSGTMPAQPTTEKQLKLRSLWSRALGIDEAEIDTEANFFDLGGDSIAAMKLVSEARLEGLRVTVADIFKTRQFLDLADVVQELPDEGRLQAASPKKYNPFSLMDVPLDAVKPQLENPEWTVVDALPARPLQEIAVKGTTTLPRYSARYELMYLDGAVDKPRLFASCQELVARNEILRTVFIEHDARCYGAVLEKLQVPVVEYRTDAGLQAFAQSLCNLDVQTLMPLGSSFVKFFFVQGPNDQSCLIFRISHAQYDEICLPVLLRQLSALYESKPVEDTLPFSSFVDHVLRTNMPASTAYWRDLLRGSSMTVLQPDRPLLSTKSVFLQRAVDISSRSKSTTLATLPSAAWALTLARRLHLRDVTFGEVATGRAINDFPRADRVVGPCWQYIPTRVVFQPGWTAADLLAAVQTQHIASAAHACMGLTEVVRDCTDWPRSVDWFDSVVHLDVDHVEELPFTGVKAQLETVYPFLEPLREWKVQAFPSADGESITMEIVTRESWLDEAHALLDGLEESLEVLVRRPDEALFA